jgi:rod shape-determining protein MreD
VAGPDRGAIVGFVAGLSYDVFLDSPLGLSALTYGVIAYVTGLFQLPLASHPQWWRVGSVAAASAAGITLWASLGVVLGQDYLLGMPVPRVAILLGVLNGLLAVPVLALARWLFHPLLPQRPAT